MNVALVTSDYPRRADAIVGGVEGAAYYLVQTLRRDFDLDVNVVVADARFTSATGIEVSDVEGTRVHRVGRRRRWPFYWSVVWAVPRAALRCLAKLGSDVVHVQGMERLAVRLGNRALLTVHGINELDTKFRGHPWLRPARSAVAGALSRRARHQVRNVIAINPYVRQFLSGGDRQRVWDIPNAVADSFFAVERRPVPGRVLAAGRLIPLKNITGLIRAFAQMAARHPEAELRLAGQGEPVYEAECRRLAKELGVASRVHFLGSLKMAHLQAELSQAACLALTSFRENAPLVISEALAAGVPIIASRVCGIPYMVEEGLTGRLINPLDADNIARGLEQILYVDDRDAMSMAARRTAEHSFRASAVGQRTVEVYQELLRAA